MPIFPVVALLLLLQRIAAGQQHCEPSTESGGCSASAVGQTLLQLSHLQEEKAAASKQEGIETIAWPDRNHKQPLPVELPHLKDRREVMPWANVPLVACDSEPEPKGSDEARILKDAVKSFCKLGYGELVEFYSDSRFGANNLAFRDDDGWVQEAYVSYIAIKGNESHVGAEMDLLLQSVHRFSSRPIILVNFGEFVPESWTPETYPNLLLMHARPCRNPVLFNLNKLRATIFTMVRTGIVVDADQFLNSGFDRMFARTAEEVTADYPYPIMPVHWTSRDPESFDGYQDYAFHFKDPAGAPKPTMRWGHAHPTFTFHAIPFMAKWTLRAIAPHRSQAPQWFAKEGWMEDEDVLNVGLWSEGATKQWCKFDIPFPSDFDLYLTQGSWKTKYNDTKWFPQGIPLAFYSAHAAKIPAESLQYLNALSEVRHMERKAIYHNGSWFDSAADLQKFDPSLKCIL
mmetsp:Transcript_31427/g.73396  ORF Transcript_31427/g.73396 Transcript_31427/m.73396 type:complete len:458 (-) Transcript_31427:48-1421(-)